MGLGDVFTDFVIHALKPGRLRDEARNSLMLLPSSAHGHLVSQGSARIRVFVTRTDGARHLGVHSILGHFNPYPYDR